MKRLLLPFEFSVNLLLLDHGEEILFAHHQEFVAVDLDGLPAVLAEQDAVALLDVHGDDVALVVALAGADRQDFALIGLFGGGVRNDDPGRSLGFLLHALDDHAIGERTKFHGISLMNSSQLAIEGKWALVYISKPDSGSLRRAVSTQPRRVLADAL